MLKLLIGHDGSQCATEAIQDLVRAGLPPSDVEEIRARLIQKVRRLKARRDAERSGPDAG